MFHEAIFAIHISVMDFSIRLLFCPIRRRQFYERGKIGRCQQQQRSYNFRYRIIGEQQLGGGSGYLIAKSRELRSVISTAAHKQFFSLEK